MNLATFDIFILSTLGIIAIVQFLPIPDKVRFIFRQIGLLIWGIIIGHFFYEKNLLKGINLFVLAGQLIFPAIIIIVNLKLKIKN